jgi:hypothetical protein
MDLDFIKPIVAIPKFDFAISPIIIDEIKRFQQSFIPLFESDFFKQMLKVAKERNSKNYKEFEKEWSWLVDKKVFTFGDYCYEVYKKLGKQKFQYELTKWFQSKSNLTIVLKELNKVDCLKNRKDIIKVAFDLHQSKKYNLAISLLLPQTEGILWDLAMKKKLVKQGYNSKKKFKNNGEWELSELSKTMFPNDKFHKILVNGLFINGFRNKILHGRNIYRNKEREISRYRSTLLILAIWRLSDEFG